MERSRQSNEPKDTEREIDGMVLEQGLNDGIRWLISLRWFAVAGLCIVITGVRFGFGQPLPILPLYVGNFVLLCYNILCHFMSHRLFSRREIHAYRKRLFFFANFQVTADLIILTYLIHFSGGLENPFVFYYIFHMIISSILLPNRAAYLQAVFISILFGVVMSIENLGLIGHYHLSLFIPEGSCRLSMTDFMWRYVIITSTLFIAVYMTTLVTNKLRRREKDLIESNSELAEQDRLKSRYVMMVSHDIQGSLASIQGYLSVVLNGFTGKLAEKTRKIIKRTEKRTRLLLEFVRDLLELSRMRSEYHSDKQKVNAQEIIQNTIEMIEPRVTEKKISLKLYNSAENSDLFGDPVALGQLFANLLGNAIRYTGMGGNVSITVRESPSKQHLMVNVKDDGIGIPEENLNRIFDDFFRADNAKRHEENGTGLGLSIVKAIVQMHGGDISVKSRLGDGTEFDFTIKRDLKCNGNK